ncbi:MAG: hypothetical protein LBU66_04830 [Treponema sp.]|nr:hypothetical protein [Treponema sp.]
METKKLSFLFVPLIILVISCGSGPQPETPKAEAEISQAEEVFDPSAITQEQYVSTREDVRRFIGELNQIIRRRDFNAWRYALSAEYIEENASPENLHRLSEMPALKRQNIVLTSLSDLFTHVVVPSRANVSDRVDNVEIEFVTSNRVKAFTVTINRAGEEVRVRLYDLERINNSWKIIN